MSVRLMRAGALMVAFAMCAVFWMEVARAVDRLAHAAP